MKTPIIILLIIAVLGAGFVGYWFYVRKPAATTTNANLTVNSTRTNGNVNALNTNAGANTNGTTNGTPNGGSRTVGLGEPVTLHKGETAQLAGTDFSVTVDGFVNSPCTGGQCIWSGLAVLMTARAGDATYTTNAQGNFDAGRLPYRVMVQSDYTTTATLTINVWTNTNGSTPTNTNVNSAPTNTNTPPSNTSTGNGNTNSTYSFTEYGLAACYVNQHPSILSQMPQNQLTTEAYRDYTTAPSGNLGCSAYTQTQIDGVRASLITDADGDGLSQNYETFLTTSDAKADSDGDGYNDYQEVLSGYNPLGPGKL